MRVRTTHNLANRIASAQGAGPVYRAQKVEGTNERLEPYILVPDDGLLKEHSPQQLRERLSEADVVVNDELPLVKGFTAELNEADKARAEKSGFKAIPDREDDFVPKDPWSEKSTPYKPKPDVARSELTEPRFLGPHTQTYTGKGVGIAIIDTGIYPHPDLTYPSSRIVAFKDFVNGNTLPYDDNGHGTHIAGDAAGSGFLSQGLYRGSAPDADLIGIKVLDKHGRGTQSKILAGLEWAIENKARYNIRVVNLSLGSGSAATRSEQDPLRQAVEKAADEGIVVVVSAGNNGPYSDTITSPGDSPKVITVGAVDDNNTPTLADDYIPHFSARGAHGTSKPDLVAPGEGILGPNAPNSRLESQVRQHTDVHRTLSWLDRLPDQELVHVPRATLEMIGLNDYSIRRFQASPRAARSEIEYLLERTRRLPMVDQNYVGIPGTSASASIVAGVVAQMLEANPEMTPFQVKEVLKETAQPLEGYEANAQGSGMISPERAIAKAVALVRTEEADGQLRFPFIYGSQSRSKGA